MPGTTPLAEGTDTQQSSGKLSRTWLHSLHACSVPVQLCSPGMGQVPWQTSKGCHAWEWAGSGNPHLGPVASFCEAAGFWRGGLSTAYLISSFEQTCWILTSFTWWYVLIASKPGKRILAGLVILLHISENTSVATCTTGAAWDETLI